jgi:hypothetical protein
LDEVTDREVSRIALAVVAILLTDLEGGYVGVRQHLETIAAATEHGFDEAFVFPGKASEKDGHTVTFFSGEGPLYGAVEVLDGFFLQPRSLRQSQPFLGHAATDFFFNLRKKRSVGGVYGASHSFRVSSYEVKEKRCRDVECERNNAFQPYPPRELLPSNIQRGYALWLCEPRHTRV